MDKSATEKAREKNCEFIDKLHDMMQKYPDLISWSADGNQIVINRLREVETNILPDYFRHRNFSSFVRQLNMYGFCKIEKSSEFLRFSHKVFRRGNQSQYHLIQRKVKARNLKLGESKYNESYKKFIHSLKAQSGLGLEAQQIALNLLQSKGALQDTMKRLKYQLDKLFFELKEARSKSVIQTIDLIKQKSYGSIVNCLALGKEIDNSIVTKFNQKRNQDLPADEDQECSLEQHMHQNQNSPRTSSKDEGSQCDFSQRFEMGEDELSAFNEFPR